MEPSVQGCIELADNDHVRLDDRVIIFREVEIVPEGGQGKTAADKSLVIAPDNGTAGSDKGDPKEPPVEDGIGDRVVLGVEFKPHACVP